ncbi:MAG: glycoside hydrolase family 15 protein [Xanthobacteraceae bacterium]
MELPELDAWIARQTGISIAAMERAMSATHLCRRRDRFGQVITPAMGSVLASPVFADWDPQPDYFFHWIRDSALVMRTVAELMEDAKSMTERQRWQRHFKNFIRFSLKLTELDERRSFALSRVNEVCAEADRRFLRKEAELGTLCGNALLAEPRFNPDGTLDIFRWSRPQHDGPALRALACLRYLAAGGGLSDELVPLLRCDLQFTVAHAGAPCIGPWEEPELDRHHYYVELVQLSALVHGRAWAMQDEMKWRDAEQKLRDGLEQYWADRHQLLIPMRPASGELADDLLDAVTLLAAWDADLPSGPHSVADARLDKTQTAIEALFAREFPINRVRAAGPALGRSRQDRYFGGGAWYPTTLAAAGLCYRRARRERVRQLRRDLIARGDAYLATLRNFTPADGALSEQIDRDTGEQTSAHHLTWSYAAFISTARERNLALAMQ